MLQALDLSDGSSEEEDVVEEYLGEGPAYKMVFVVNTELSMGLGKTASQVAHAAIGLYRLLIEEQQRFGEMLLYWEQFGLEYSLLYNQIDFVDLSVNIWNCIRCSFTVYLMLLS